MKETEKSKLLSQFEILEGITSDMFDDKDWTKFDRFCERQYIEHKGTVLTTEEVMKGRSSAYEFIDFEETLKEAAEKYANQYNAVYFPCYESYLEGAEFAQKELYTKEDMLEAFNAGNKRGHSGYPNTDNWTQPTFEDFISRKKEEK